MKFNPQILTPEDRELAYAMLGHLGIQRLPDPDLCIAPDGDPYLYRWWLTPRREEANCYLHVQVASDPERPLHDHPWANQSVILAGGYDEIIQRAPPLGDVDTRMIRKGMTIHRQAWEAHRLILPPEIPYTMSLFTTGPVLRDWGFWCTVNGRDVWYPHEAVTSMTPDGRSVWRDPK